MVRTALSLVVALLALAGTAVGDEIANLEKLIEHYRTSEARQSKLLKELEGGTVVMAIPHKDSQRIPMRKSEILDYLISYSVANELGKPKPDVAAAERRARDMATLFFRQLAPSNEKEIARLKEGIAQMRESRQRAESRLAQLRQNATAIKGGKFDLEGIWKRDADGWEVRVNLGTVDDANTYGARNTFPPAQFREVVRPGEMMWELKRDPSRASAYEGKFMVRSSDGTNVRTVWRDTTVTMSDNDHLSGSNGFGSWTRDGADEISGIWNVRVSSQYGWFDYEWKIRRDAEGIWTAEQSLLRTNHGVHKPREGEKFHNYTLTKKGDGFELYGSGTDPNPHNPGAFTQTGKLTISGGKISGTCEHKGSKLQHPFKIEGSREAS